MPSLEGTHFIFSYERLCTGNFAIFQDKSTNLASWGILMQIFQKLYNSYDVIIGIFQGPVTLPFLKV